MRQTKIVIPVAFKQHGLGTYPERSDQRAAYRQQIVAILSHQLATVDGTSFSRKILRRIMQFAHVFPDGQTVASAMRQLNWTHIILALIPIEDPLKRAFYTQLCIHEKWRVRTFQERIQSMLYEPAGDFFSQQ